MIKKRFVCVLGLLMLCGLVVGSLAFRPADPAAAGSPMSQSATGSDDAAGDECGAGTETMDAASCSTGGWSYAGCCHTLTRWRQGTTTKCCGVCMQ